MKRALSLLLLAVPVAVLAQVQFMQDGTNVNAPAKRVNCSGGVTCSPLGRDGVTLTASGSGGGYDGGKVAEAYMADACVTCQTATTAGYASTADTATSFVTDPNDCEPGWYATGIDKFGNLTCSAVSGGSGTSWTFAAFGSTTTASTTTNVTIAGFSIPAHAGTNLHVKCIVITGAAATTTGVQVTFAGPAATRISVTRMSCSSATATVNAIFNAFGLDARTASAGTTRCSEWWDLHLFNVTAGANITAQVKSEVAASAVNVYAESYCEYLEY